MAHTAKILIRDVVAAKKQDTVWDAANAMKKAGIGCVMVTDASRLVGVLSERDVVGRVVAVGRDPTGTSVEDVMTPNPVSVDCSEPLERVFEVLAEGRFRHLAITEEGRLVGIVSLSDLAGVLRDVLREEKFSEYFVEFMEKKSSNSPPPRGGE